MEGKIMQYTDIDWELYNYLYYLSDIKEWNRNPCAGECAYVTKTDLMYAIMSMRGPTDIAACEGKITFMEANEMIQPAGVNFKIDLKNLFRHIYNMDLLDMGPSPRDSSSTYFFDYLKIIYDSKGWATADKTALIEISKRDFILTLMRNPATRKSERHLARYWNLLIDFGCFSKTCEKDVCEVNIEAVKKEILKSDM